MKSLRVISVSLCLLALGTLFFTGCGAVEDPWKDKGKRPYVVTSFPPLYCFAQNIAKDGTAIICLTSGRGPHHYEYTHADTLYLSDANLLLSNGLTLDDRFIDRMVQNCGNSNLTAVKLGEKLPQNLLVEMGHHHHGPGEEDHDHGQYDPHLWLGISDGEGGDGPAIYLVDQMREAFIKVDPANKAIYEKNAKEYKEKLRKLQAYGETELKALKDNKTPIVTSHESLGYFKKSFGLNVVGSIRLRNNVEVNSGKLTDLIKKCVKLKPRIIATEPQYNDASAKTLKDELGKEGLKDIELIRVDPLETGQPAKMNKEWFEKKMRENIDNLAKVKP